MIFSTFGNVPLRFDRLAEAVDRYAEGSNEEVVVQCGYTNYPFKWAKAIPFLDEGGMAWNIRQADVVVTQGGWGTISECLRIGKRVVAVPRLKGVEHNHDQAELVRALESGGHLLAVYDTVNLEKIIELARNTVPVPLPKGNIPEIIGDFIGSFDEY